MAMAAMVKDFVVDAHVAVVAALHGREMDGPFHCYVRAMPFPICWSSIQAPDGADDRPLSSFSLLLFYAVCPRDSSLGWNHHAYVDDSS